MISAFAFSFSFILKHNSVSWPKELTSNLQQKKKKETQILQSQKRSFTAESKNSAVPDAIQNKD